MRAQNSSIFDVKAGIQLSPTFVKLVSWYVAFLCTLQYIITSTVLLSVLLVFTRELHDKHQQHGALYLQVRQRVRLLVPRHRPDHAHAQGGLCIIVCETSENASARPAFGSQVITELDPHPHGRPTHLAMALWHCSS